jgi:polyisoprenoid-binding protein YceI
MNRKSILVRALAAAAVLALAAPAALTQKKTFELDRAHSEINFVAEALLLTAHGYFGTFDADLQLDPKDWESSTVAITIDAKSINTRNERRDNHLRSGDFFDAANHPSITFVSSKVTRVDDKNISIAGNMTIRGVTKPVVIPVQVRFWGERNARFTGTFNLSRKEYGMVYNSNANPIEDMVTVQFNFTIREPRPQQQGTPPPAKPPGR